MTLHTHLPIYRKRSDLVSLAYDGAMAEHGKELFGAGLIASGGVAAIEEKINQ